MEKFFEERDVPTFARGVTVMGKVLQVSENGILVDIGYKTEGILSPQELSPFRRGEVKEGEEIEVLVTYIHEEEGTVYVSEKQALYAKRLSELERALRTGEAVAGTIEEVIENAGYRVNLKGMPAFLPGSHLGNDLPANIEKLRGKEVFFKILELDRREKNLVVSHKEYLKDLEEKRKDEIFRKLSVGQVLEGTIKSIADFGLFVDVGGFEGLVHRTEISWKEVPVPPNTFKVGDKIKVKVLALDRANERISLSIKQLRPDPWIGISRRYPAGKKVHGEVISITDFGAFVKLEEDVEGLVHISELSWQFPKDPREAVKEGDQVEVVVLHVDAEKRKISLSMRRAQPDPWENIEKKYPKGMIVKGKVSKLAEFGAFVSLEPGVEALLHISEMSWERVNSPTEVVKEGDEITAKVIKSDNTRRKIRLSLRELKEDPWHKFLELYSINSIVEGKVTQLKDFGAFVKITDEVEGLIHVSEITNDKINSPADVLKVGDSVRARIIGINEEKRQVRLSMKSLQGEEHLSKTGHEMLTIREHLKSKDVSKLLS